MLLRARERVQGCHVEKNYCRFLPLDGNGPHNLALI